MKTEMVAYNSQGKSRFISRNNPLRQRAIELHKRYGWSSRRIAASLRVSKNEVGFYLIQYLWEQESEAWEQQRLRLNAMVDAWLKAYSPRMVLTDNCARLSPQSIKAARRRATELEETEVDSEGEA